jgi:hypothetical protein
MPEIAAFEESAFPLSKQRLIVLLASSGMRTAPVDDAI